MVCEKCWADANGNAREYIYLLNVRKDNPCTPEEQAGEFAKKCPKCKRMTIHPYCHECTACGYKEAKNE